MKFINILFAIFISTSLSAEVIKLEQFNYARKYNKMVGDQGLGGDLVGNGGGISEKNILFSYVNLKNYIQICLKSPSCNLTREERTLLNKILANIPKETANKEQIHFMSEKNNPGFFMIDGELKIAKTGNDVGSKIYINLDLLYTKNSHDEVRPFSISDAVSLLIHELGHHHNVKNHSKLDLLGIKVSMSLGNHSDRASLFPHTNDFMAISINQRDANKFPQILIYFDNTFMDISNEFKKAIKCPGPFFLISKEKPHGANFHNMYWKKLSRRMNQYEFTVSGNVSTYCDGEIYNPTQLKATRVAIRFKLVLMGDEKKKSGYGWNYLRDSLKVKHYKKKWWAAFKLPNTGIHLPVID